MLNFGLLAQWVLSKRELPNLNRAGCYQQPGMGEVLLYIDVLCIIDLMVLQHRADTEDSVAAVIRDTCSFEFLSVYENGTSCGSLGVLEFVCTTQ